MSVGRSVSFIAANDASGIYVATILRQSNCQYFSSEFA